MDLIILDLGDSSFAIPTSFLIIIASGIFLRSTKHTVLWAASLAACVLSVAAVKLSFMVCDAGNPDRPFSPSGHAAISAFFYGLLSLAITSQIRQHTQFLKSIIPGGLIAVAVGIALVSHHDHSIAEVIVGLLWGWSCVAFSTRIAGYPGRIERVPPFLVALPVLLCIGVGYTIVHSGNRSPSERHLRQLSHSLRLTGWDQICPIGHKLANGSRVHWD